MILATTNSGTTYCLDMGNLYRLPTTNSGHPDDAGHILTGVQLYLGWYDDRPRVTEYPSRNQSWEIKGYDPVTQEKVTLTTSPVVFDTNTSDWARSWDEEPHAYCWDCFVPLKVVLSRSNPFGNVASNVMATDQIAINPDNCCVCGSA